MKTSEQSTIGGMMMKSGIVFVLNQLLLLAAVSCDQFPRDNPNDPVNMEDRDSSVTDAGVPNIIIFEKDNEPSIDLLDPLELSPLNNNNGKIEAGETIRFYITLQNEGTQRAEGVRATKLTYSSDGCVDKSEIVSASGDPSTFISYGDIEPGQLSTLDNIYYRVEFSLDKCHSNSSVDLTVEVTDIEGRSWALPFQRTIEEREGISVDIVDTIINDDIDLSRFNNDNQTVQPGETIEITFKLENTGVYTIRGLAATATTKPPDESKDALPCLSNNIEVPESPSKSIFYGDLVRTVESYPEGDPTPYFQLKFDLEQCKSVQTVDLILQLTDALNRRLEVPYPIYISESNAFLALSKNNSNSINDSKEISDTNDGDSKADPGETVHLIPPSIQNIGKGDIARNVILTLAEDDWPSCIEDLQIVNEDANNNSILYGDIPGGQSATPQDNRGYIEIKFSSENCSKDERVKLPLDAKDSSNNSWLIGPQIQID